MRRFDPHLAEEVLTPLAGLELVPSGGGNQTLNFMEEVLTPLAGLELAMFSLESKKADFPEGVHGRT